jgi:branched-chain amino acid transport system ATP-binding protein
MSTTLLEVAALEAGYGDALVLKNVTLKVMEGSITAVIGSNGAGKTTLMRALAGILPIRSGAVTFGGRSLSGSSPGQRVDFGIAMVPEGRLVFPDLNIQETLRIGAYTRRARAGWRERMERIFEIFPALKERRSQRAGSMSGGEQQMLALGRGLMSAPRLLLLDEPTLGLAPKMAQWVFETVLRIRDLGVTVCLVEQDVRSALAIADYAYLIENGLIVKDGTGAALAADADIRENLIGL